MSELNEYLELIEQIDKQPKNIDSARAYKDLARYGLQNNQVKIGLQQSAKGKKIIEDIVYSQLGIDMNTLDEVCKKQNASPPELELWWQILLVEAPFLLDSYMLYLERKRDFDKKFYQPRRKCFMKIGLIQALQDILEDKLDILSISMPPGSGKLVADDTPVLTTKGWKNHGDLVVGDYVYGIDGKPKMVQHVFPKDKADCLITFSNKQQIQCHENHEWVVVDNKCGGVKTLETKEILKEIEFHSENGTHSRWFLPKREKIDNTFNELCSISITSIERVEPKQGNCIQVEGGIYCVGKTMIPTHNSTVEKFFHSFVMGKFPDDYNLFFSHSAGITRMYYEGVLSILQDPEYTWGEIFPGLGVTSTNAKNETINVGKYKPFQNLMTASVGSSMAGKVRASKFLLVDDMISKIEEALNNNTLDKLWNIYTTDARQRKVTGCKEIHIATRWSVRDIIGRLQATYGNNERCKFIAVPDIDPETGESNFMFDVNGFTTEFFHDQELLMDDITYRCLYKNDPVEREGLLYHEEDLRRYLEIPMREPDAIIGICDTKSKGTDFLFLPCFYQYGEDYYLVDCICTDSSDYGVQYDRMSNLILGHNMQQVEFESNAGGDRVAFEVQNRVKEHKGRCNITTKPTETNKETRIIVNADWVKKHVIFKDKSLYSPKEDYGIMMTWLLSYSVAGKNVHDDVPDGMANFALFATRGSNVATVEAIKNPFRTKSYW